MKAVQTCSTLSGKAAVKSLLDVLHPLNLALPPTDHPLFQQVLLVPPDDMPTPLDDDEKDALPSLKELEDVVKGVFESHDAKSLKARIKTALKHTTSPAVQRALKICMKNVDVIPVHVISGWFAASRSAQNLLLQDFANREARLIEEVFAGKMLTEAAAPEKK